MLLTLRGMFSITGEEKIDTHPILYYNSERFDDGNDIL